MEASSTTNPQKQSPKTYKRQDEPELKLVDEAEIESLKQSLPKLNWLNAKVQLIKIHEFWYPIKFFHNILTFQRHFLARDSDLIVTSFPKTGTTWLKSLLFSIANRSLYRFDQTPLLTNNPHELVYDLETGVYRMDPPNPKIPGPLGIMDVPAPRLLHSHMPYASLPESIKTSGCKILYICRNPLDTLVSHWHFYPKLIKRMDEDFQPPSDINSFFEDFCQGNVLYGPFFEHVLGYWKQSLERPDKVLFLKYEDLKENPRFYVRKLAEFVGLPFSSVEENEGVIEAIIELCSLKALKELEINKSESLNKYVENKDFFRDGEVGGWQRYLTASMAERMCTLVEQKLESTGLSFKFLSE